MEMKAIHWFMRIVPATVVVLNLVNREPVSSWLLTTWVFIAMVWHELAWFHERHR